MIKNPLEPIRIEVCVDSLAGALTAQAAGADRLELAANLPIGGTTPPAGLLRLVRRQVALPIMVLIRPRGGDFVYTETEAETLLAEIAFAKETGADGIVCGALDPQGSVALELTRRLIEAAAPLPFTFHRAFDLCREPFAALLTLKELGAARILTSGQAASPAAGLALLRSLKQQSGQLIIMPGGGVNLENIADILRQLQPREIHFSGGRPMPSAQEYRPEAVQMGADRAGDAQFITDHARLAGLIAAVRAFRAD